VTHPFLLLLLGFVVGTLTGCFGVGGGFLMTPALNILGLPIACAIGTNFSAVVVNTFVGAVRQYRLGNVDFKLGLTTGASCVMGVEFGKRMVLFLGRLNLAESCVRISYMALLLTISLLMLRECYLRSKGKGPGEERKMILRGRSLWRNVPPRISLPASGIRISLWPIIGFGGIIGFLAGFMGFGGGFIILPLLIYVIGAPTLTAIGTTSMVVFFTSSYGSIAYALTGNVKWMAALVILLGSITGVQVGVSASKDMTDIRLRLLFALLLFFVVISVLLKELKLATTSIYIMIGSASALAGIMLISVARRTIFRGIKGNGNDSSM